MFQSFTLLGCTYHKNNKPNGKVNCPTRKDFSWNSFIKSLLLIRNSRKMSVPIVTKRGIGTIWNSERGLLLLGSAVWWFALSWYVATFGIVLWLSLVCAQFALGIWYSYLVSVNLWFCICERELFGCIWDLGLRECLYTDLYYPKFVIVKFVRRCPWM